MPARTRGTYNPYDRQYRKRRAVVLANATHCTYCGHAISDTLPNNHPYKATTDHVHAVKHGGSDGVLVPCCRRCNSRKRDKSARTLTDDAARGRGWF